MARKPKPKPKSVKPAPAAVLKDRILDAALALSAQMGWDVLTLADIAEAAGVTLVELQAQVDQKSDILRLYGRRVDQRVLAACAQNVDEAPVRDRLFDILMERFDVLSDDREALCAILRALRRDPKQMIVTLPHLAQSMCWMLEAVRADTSGWKGAARVAGLTAVYLRALCTWADDDSADMAKTMKVLDEALGRAEQLSGMVGL